MSSPPEPEPSKASPPKVPAPDASVLEVIGRRLGPVPKVLLRDTPSEHGSRMLDADSPEARQVPAGRGDYEFHGERARGAVGHPQGHDRDLGRDVAVKVLSGASSPSARRSSRASSRRRRSAAAPAPGVVRPTSWPRGRALLPMKGEGAHRRAPRRRAAPDADRARVLAIPEQVCQTMAYAH